MPSASATPIHPPHDPRPPHFDCKAWIMDHGSDERRMNMKEANNINANPFDRRDYSIMVIETLAVLIYNNIQMMADRLV